MSHDLLSSYVNEYLSWLDAHPYEPADSTYATQAMLQDQALTRVAIWFATRTDIHTREGYGYKPADAISLIRADVAAHAQAIEQIEQAHRAWFETNNRTVLVDGAAYLVPTEQRLAELELQAAVEHRPACAGCGECFALDPGQAYDDAIQVLVAEATEEQIAEYAHSTAYREDEPDDTGFAMWLLAQMPVPRRALSTEAMDAAIGLLVEHLDAEHADARLSLDEALGEAFGEYLAKPGSLYVQLMSEVPTQRRVDEWAAEHRQRLAASTSDGVS